MGRATYLDMAQYWPTAAGSANVHEAEIAAIMNNTPKVGFSRTLQAVGCAGGADCQRRRS